MADAGLDVRNADLFVGTSSGARVALELVSGRTFDDVYGRRATPAGPSPRGPAEPPPKIDWGRISEGVERARAQGGSTSEVLRRYGALAREVAVGTGEGRRETVAAQLPMTAWPERRVMITAVDVESGERRAFDRESGIDLVDAVIATTASFGAPPVMFEGSHYVDGGYHSSDNADLAIGHDRVLIVGLRSPPNAMRLVSVEDGVAALRAAGAQVEVIHPDEEVMAALAPTGGQMNPASGLPALAAGRSQGQRVVNEAIAALWG
jgi:NTE family protein